MLITVHGNVYTAWIYATCFTAENLFSCTRTVFLYFTRSPQYTANNSLQDINRLGSVISFSMARQPLVRLASSLLRFRDHTQDTPHSVALLWVNDRTVAETSTRKHKQSQETDIRASGGSRTHNPSKRSTADSRFRPHGHCNHLGSIVETVCTVR